MIESWSNGVEQGSPPHGHPTDGSTVVNLSLPARHNVSLLDVHQTGLSQSYKSLVIICSSVKE